MEKSISLVIATFNSGEILKNTLRKNLKNSWSKIIVIDGFSSDDTLKVIKNFNDPRITFFSLKRQGLSHARNYGHTKVNSEYTMHAGPDNIISWSVVLSMMSELDNFDLVSCKTRLWLPVTYLDKAHDISKNRLTSGKVKVVGTPYMCKTELLSTYKFNEAVKNADDSLLCAALIEAGKSIFRIDDFCFETGFNSFKSLIERYRRWGCSDAEFFQQNSFNWSTNRKLVSLLHPLKVELYDNVRLNFNLKSVKYFPFFIFFSIFRFFIMLKYIIRAKLKK